MRSILLRQGLVRAAKMKVVAKCPERPLVQHLVIMWAMLVSTPARVLLGLFEHKVLSQSADSGSGGLGSV